MEKLGAAKNTNLWRIIGMVKMDIQRLHESILNYSQASYSRSGGPGGQNVNKVNTKVTLRLELAALEGLSEAEFGRMKTMLASRLSSCDEELLVQSSDERLQSVNEANAYQRLEALIVSAAKLPKKRRPTRPSKAKKEERLKIKKLNSLKKTNRQTAAID
jgi:ribosome-associated protein